jgi:hypothetical protein
MNRYAAVSFLVVVVVAILIVCVPILTYSSPFSLSCLSAGEIALCNLPKAKKNIIISMNIIKQERKKQIQIEWQVASSSSSAMGGDIRDTFHSPFLFIFILDNNDQLTTTTK